MSKNVPEGWEIRTSEAIYERLRVPRVHDRTTVNVAGKFPVIDQSENSQIGFLEVEPDFVCDEDNPIVTFANHTCAVRKMKIPFGVIQNVFPLKSRQDTDINFIFQILKEGIEPEGYKGHYPKLRETEFLIPPLPEQKKIASILTSVDDVIENTRKQIDKLQDLKKATMNELLTKGIGHTEFKDSELGRIPKSWEVVELRENLTFISYGFTNPMPESKSGNLMVTAKDVNNGVIDYENARKTTSEAFEELLTDKSRPKIGDVLLTKDGTLGRLAVVDKEGICINQSVAVLRPNEKISSMFLFNMLSSPYYQKTMLDNAGGSTIKHIYITVVDKMKVVKPPLDEQDAITTVLSKINVQFDIVCRKLSQTQSLKKSLMQDLLTGKVRVKVN